MALFSCHDVIRLYLIGQKSMRVLVMVVLLSLVVSGFAKDKAVLVLDASGSMWGQVGGQAKIDLAKEVLNDLVDNWDKEVELGLSVYGHRSKGDCNDIEMVYPISVIDRDRLTGIVDGISPKGKTPLSKAVRHAAEQLKYTEDKATVILISDGKESCKIDPCTMATDLEKLGVDFTAHVIGFDVDKQTQSELRCIADNTGGNYYDAKGAKELSEALKQVTQFPQTIQFRAVAKDGSDISKSSVSYVFDNGQQQFKAVGSGQLTQVMFDVNGNKGLSAGQWKVVGKVGFYQALQEIEIEENHQKPFDILFVNRKPEISLVAPEEGIVGSKVVVEWDTVAPDNARVILVEAAAQYENYGFSHVDMKDIKSAEILLPAQPGEYELRVVANGETISRKAIQVVSAEFVIGAESEAIAGTLLTVSLKGPADVRGMVVLDKIGSKVRPYGISHIYADKDKSALKLQLPAEEGEYVVRWLSQKNELLTEKSINLKAATVSIIVPDSVRGGSSFLVKYNGPEGARGQMIVAHRGSKVEAYGLSHAYLTQQAVQEVKLVAPVTPGVYTVRRLGAKNDLIHEVDLNVVDAEVSLEVPSTVIAGTVLNLTSSDAPLFSGSLVLDNVNSKVRAYGLSHAYFLEPSARLRMVAQPGNYMVRWLNARNKLLWQKEIKITAPTIDFILPSKIRANEQFKVSINATSGLSGNAVIQKPGDKPWPYGLSSQNIVENGGQYEDVFMKAPEQPGQYELRWITSKGELAYKKSFSVD